MKRNLTFSLLFICLSLYTGYGQQISNVNFTDIYKNISTSSSSYFYPVLLSRYEKNDTTLTHEQYKHLYYGFTQQPTYDPYEKDLRQKEFNALIAAKDYQKAIAVGKEGIKKSPFNMNYIFGLHYAYDNLGQQAESQKWLNKFEKLLEVLEKSGDGKTSKTAIVVISIGDEQIYMETLGLTVKNRDLSSGTDKIILEEPNELHQKELYFNVEKLGWQASGNKRTVKK
ncbi:DUF4919 domain-containing protein [Xanthocytophaga agilis]|uniref:DUF4919 domain-containing protein n=1 Tax=Xanthocytophaga agilis TaxID=3048010 RepID=A0AAE3UHM4_9BACT|nr:DUF4919 domain-containing protein [Xanthocytophaga agilis]MDJ1504481.1 DUF4919 domain-containing protein [Xanthocytophaga agilis]